MMVLTGSAFHLWFLLHLLLFAHSPAVTRAPEGGGEWLPRPRNIMPSPKFVAPAATGVAWEPVVVTAFGAVGDGKHNDGPALQASWQ